jgi:hypothetical protein
MTDITQVLAGIKPRETRVRICLRGDLLALHEQLTAEFAAAREGDQSENRHPLAPQVAARISDVEEEMRASEVEFHLIGLGRRAWSDLLRSYPPRNASDDEDLTDAQLKADEQVGYDADRFPLAAVAASCQDPQMSVEQAESLAERLNDGQWRQLWRAAVDVNMVGIDVPKFGAAYAALSSTAPKSGTPLSTESPEASS